MNCANNNHATCRWNACFKCLLRTSFAPWGGCINPFPCPNTEFVQHLALSKHDPIALFCPIHDNLCLRIFVLWSARRYARLHNLLVNRWCRGLISNSLSVTNVCELCFWRCFLPDWRNFHLLLVFALACSSLTAVITRFGSIYVKSKCRANSNCLVVVTELELE